MTYRELRDLLDTLNEKQLDQTMTIKDLLNQEYFPISGFSYASKHDDVIGPGHLFFAY